MLKFYRLYLDVNLLGRSLSALFIRFCVQTGNAPISGVILCAQSLGYQSVRVTK